VQLIASTSAALFITGIYVEEAAVTAGTYIIVQLATGAAAAETVVGQYLIAPQTGSTVTRSYRPIYPPIAVANATRIACKTADSVGSQAKLITLECIAQSNVVDDGVAVATVTTVTNQLTAAAIATAIWQDAVAGDFTTASSIGKALYIANVAPGAAGGHFIAGTNAATTITTALTTTFTGNVTGSVASVTGAVGSVTAGVTLAASAVQAIWDALTTALTTVGSIGKRIADNLDAAITSRMASYTQPTGFLAATFPAGTVASTTNITAGVVTTATNLTNLPSIPANWITAAGITAAALNGKGDWNVGKTGYSLVAAYDAAKTASQAGDAMTLTAAYNAAKTAAQAGDAMTLTASYDAAKTAAQAGDAMTLTGGERTTLAGVVNTTAIVESYRANGAAPTPAQFMSEVLAHLGESAIVGTTKTVNKMDHATAAATFTLDDATTPSSITRAT
jgi:hypothetical protein